MNARQEPCEIWEIDEISAWHRAKHITASSPAYGIAACWARYRWVCDNRQDVDTWRDHSICREIRGSMASHAMAHHPEDLAW